jgi:hypothetical protein
MFARLAERLETLKSDNANKLQINAAVEKENSRIEKKNATAEVKNKDVSVQQRMAIRQQMAAEKLMEKSRQRHEKDLKQVQQIQEKKRKESQASKNELQRQNLLRKLKLMRKLLPTRTPADLDKITPKSSLKELVALDVLAKDELNQAGGMDRFKWLFKKAINGAELINEEFLKPNKVSKMDLQGIGTAVQYSDLSDLDPSLTEVYVELAPYFNTNCYVRLGQQLFEMFDAYSNAKNPIINKLKDPVQQDVVDKFAAL